MQVLICRREAADHSHLGPAVCGHTPRLPPWLCCQWESDLWPFVSHAGHLGRCWSLSWATWNNCLINNSNFRFAQHATIKPLSTLVSTCITHYFSLQLLPPVTSAYSLVKDCCLSIHARTWSFGEYNVKTRCWFASTGQRKQYNSTSKQQQHTNIMPLVLILQTQWLLRMRASCPPPERTAFTLLSLLPGE